MAKFLDDFIDELYDSMLSVRPLSSLMLDVVNSHFRDYMILGGMPEVVNRYIESGQFSGTLQMQQQLLLDYEEDITKYASGFDKAKVLAVYRHISTLNFLLFDLPFEWWSLWSLCLLSLLPPSFLFFLYSLALKSSSDSGEYSL